MNFMSPLASLVGTEVGHITGRIKRTVIVNVLIAVFALAAVIFLIAAGFMALALEVGGIYAALIIAAAFLLLAGLVYVGSLIVDARRRRLLAERRRSSETSAFLTSATLTALPVLLRSPMVRTLGIPAAAIAAVWLISKGGDSDD